MLAFVVVGPISARADLITLSISEQATGTLGGRAFTNQLITFSGSFTTQVLASCLADFTCDDGPGNFDIDNEADLPPADLGLTVAITVGGLGTFVGEGVDYFNFLYTGNLEDIVVLAAGDSGGRFSLPADPNLIGPNCSDYTYQQYCPPRAFTSGGDLILTSAGDTYSTNVAITDTSAVPEPKTLVLLTTGLLGAVGILRRRLL
jgi:hypothetical protein